MIYHDIQYTVYLLQEFFLVLFLLASFLARRMSHVACRMSLIAVLLRNTKLAIQQNSVLRSLQFNEIACYEINYEVCNSTEQRVTRSTTKFAIQRNSVYTTKFAIQRDSVHITRFAIQRNNVLRDQRDSVIKF